MLRHQYLWFKIVCIINILNCNLSEDNIWVTGSSGRPPGSDHIKPSHHSRSAFTSLIWSGNSLEENVLSLGQLEINKLSNRAAVTNPLNKPTSWGRCTRDILFKLGRQWFNRLEHTRLLSVLQSSRTRFSKHVSLSIISSVNMVFNLGHVCDAKVLKQDSDPLGKRPFQMQLRLHKMKWKKL